MLFDFSMAVSFVAVGAAFVFAALLAGALIRPRRTVAARRGTYECGEKPVGRAWYNFNPRFIMMALIFLIFDAEIAVTYPAVAVLRRWAERGKGFTALVELAIFLALLLAGFSFLWKRGDLEWMKNVESDKEES